MILHWIAMHCVAFKEMWKKNIYPRMRSECSLKKEVHQSKKKNNNKNACIHLQRAYTCPIIFNMFECYLFLFTWFASRFLRVSAIVIATDKQMNKRTNAKRKTENCIRNCAISCAFDSSTTIDECLTIIDGLMRNNESHTQSAQMCTPRRTEEKLCTARAAKSCVPTEMKMRKMWIQFHNLCVANKI